MLSLVGVVTAPRPAEARRVPSDPQAADLVKLRAVSERPPVVVFNGPIPQAVSARVQLPGPAEAHEDPVVDALRFLTQYRELYRLHRPRTELVPTNVAIDGDASRISFGQRRGRVSVFGSQLAVQLVDGRVLATLGSYLPRIPRLPPAVVAARTAVRRALRDFRSPGAVRVGRIRPVYFNASLFLQPETLADRGMDARTHRAWQLTLQDGQGWQWRYIVDAQSGAVLFRMSLVQSHAPDLRLGIFTGFNTPQFVCGAQNIDRWFDEKGVLSGRSPDAEGFAAFTAVRDVYDFYYSRFHRHSWDGHETRIDVSLDVGITPPNAMFIPWCWNFVFSDNFSTLDILAHEITHGVIDKSAGLLYVDQPGAMNESFADVFAAMIDKDWTIGENLPGGARRSMSNPPTFGHPDLMSSFLVTTADNGGVHTNSGILNKAAFLIANGGTHNGIVVGGIGRQKTAELYYRVLNLWLTFNADFVSLRFAMVEQAKIFARIHQHGFTNDDTCAVVNAFAAVELGVPDLDCDGLEDSADTDVDGDTVEDGSDNCRRVPNPGQQDTDGDGMGNACDSDDDNDGRADVGDNCSLVKNTGQADVDGDGVGDVCDDSDYDGVIDATDNCRVNRNADQADLDHDSRGDACDLDVDGDSIENVTDNCRRVGNADQADADGDGRGDACDSCPAAVDGPVDTDHDGVNDACDPDDDNDRVPDGTDNCPNLRNADQADYNQNGIGAACDPEEQISIGIGVDRITGAIQFVRGKLDKAQIVLLACVDVRCPSSIPPNFRTDIRVRSSAALTVILRDDDGAIIKNRTGADVTLRFFPSPAMFFRPPSTLQVGARQRPVRPYRGRRYVLEILPPPDVSFERRYRLTVTARSEVEATDIRRRRTD